MASIDTIRQRLSALAFPYATPLDKLDNREAVPVSWNLYGIMTNGRDRTSNLLPPLEEDNGSDSSVDTDRSPPRTSHVGNIRIWIESMNNQTSPPVRTAKSPRLVSPRLPSPRFTPVSPPQQFVECLYSRINWSRLQMNAKLHHDLFIDDYVLHITGGKFVNFNCFYPPKHPEDIEEAFELLTSYLTSPLEIGSVLYYILKDYGADGQRDTLDIPSDLRYYMDALYHIDRFNLASGLRCLKQTTHKIDTEKLLQYSTIVPLSKQVREHDGNALMAIQVASQHMASQGLVETMKCLGTSQVPERLKRNLAVALVDQFPEPPNFWSEVKRYGLSTDDVVRAILDKTLAQKAEFSKLPRSEAMQQAMWQQFAIQKIICETGDYPADMDAALSRIGESGAVYSQLAREVQELINDTDTFL